MEYFFFFSYVFSILRNCKYDIRNASNNLGEGHDILHGILRRVALFFFLWQGRVIVFLGALPHILVALPPVE
jgi:hypothetical protein